MRKVSSRMVAGGLADRGAVGVMKAGWALQRRPAGGWLAYYTAFYPGAVRHLCRRIDRHLMRWAKWKYKRLKNSNARARTWLRGVRARDPELFVHWRCCAQP